MGWAAAVLTSNAAPRSSMVHRNPKCWLPSTKPTPMSKIRLAPSRRAKAMAPPRASRPDAIPWQGPVVRRPDRRSVPATQRGGLHVPHQTAPLGDDKIHARATGPIPSSPSNRLWQPGPAVAALARWKFALEGYGGLSSCRTPHRQVRRCGRSHEDLRLHGKGVNTSKPACRWSSMCS